MTDELPDLERFAAVAAHDLRNTLLGVVGYADLLSVSLSKEQPEPPPAELLAGIRASARSGLTLVDDLLAYVSVHTRRLPEQRVDLTVLAQRAAQTALSAHPDGAVEVGELGAVDGDPELLRKLLASLLRNALTYVAEGAGAQVWVTSAPEQQTGHLVVRVADNGPGIRVEEREEVFEPFERGSTTGGVPGAGLGLTIARRVVSRYGGRIWIEDSPYGGACVAFTLPHSLPTACSPDDSSR